MFVYIIINQKYYCSMCTYFFDGFFGNDVPKKTSIKIALIGDGSTGKTSYFDRITSGDSPEYKFSKHYDATQGCNICQIEMMIGEYPITLHLFDTAGQEKFGMLRESYLMGADGIILMYDVTDKASKKNVIVRWLPEIKNILTKTKMSDIPVAVVGNKCDKISVHGKSDCEYPMLGFRTAALASNYENKFGSIEHHLMSVKANDNLMEPIIWLLRNILKKNTRDIKKSEKKPLVIHCNK